MKIVLDTNVIVAALRSRKGASNQLLQRVVQGDHTATASTALILEYEDVLLRPGMIPDWSENEISDFLDDLCGVIEEAQIYFRWRPFLPDPKDDMVFECALASGATHIVTANLREFRGLQPFHISVMTPFEFLCRVKP